MPLVHPSQVLNWFKTTGSAEFYISDELLTSLFIGFYPSVIALPVIRL